MPTPLSEADILFPTASTDFSIAQTLRTLKRDNISIVNRLQSIAHDADFVLSVAEAYQLPLVANERCGSWYVRSEEKDGSAYFKSTDGHYGQWSFSLRRLNLQVLDVITRSPGPKGCVIVDSTRRGKSMPDALSKTVPIWIAVLNRFVFPELKTSHPLVTPRHVVSQSEHEQIEERIPQFLENFRALDINAGELKDKLNFLPIKATWITADEELPRTGPPNIAYNLIVLCTASGSTTNLGKDSSAYVQGAADDSESWACGLNASMYWKYHRQLMSKNEESLLHFITTEISELESAGDVAFKVPVLIKPTSSIYIADNRALPHHSSSFDIIVSCMEKAPESIQLPKQSIVLKCGSGKVGSRQLRHLLWKTRVLGPWLNSNPSAKVLITCPTGRDLAVGVALAVIARFRSQVMGGADSEARLSVDKPNIKRWLSWIMVSIPDAAPSRATLQSVNAYLLG